jgi:hypothetical protein
LAEITDFLSFAKEIEKQQVKVNIWQNNGGSQISYQFRLLCRLETQHFMVFRLSGDYHDYEFNPRLDLNFTHGLILHHSF